MSELTPGTHVRFRTATGIHHGDVINCNGRYVRIGNTTQGRESTRHVLNVQPILHDHQRITADLCSRCNPRH